MGGAGSKTTAYAHLEERILFRIFLVHIFYLKLSHISKNPTTASSPRVPEIHLSCFRLQERLAILENPPCVLSETVFGEQNQ